MAASRGTTNTAAINSAASTATAAPTRTPPPIPPRPKIASNVSPQAAKSSRTPFIRRATAASDEKTLDYKQEEITTAQLQATLAQMISSAAESDTALKVAPLELESPQALEEIKRNLAERKQGTETWPAYLCRQTKEVAHGIWNGFFRYHPGLTKFEKVTQTALSTAAFLGNYELINKYALKLFNLFWDGENPEMTSMGLGLFVGLATYIYSKKLLTDGTFFISNHRYTIDALWLMVVRQAEALEQINERLNKLEEGYEALKNPKNASAGKHAIVREQNKFHDAIKELNLVIDLVSQMRHMTPERALEFRNKIQRMQNRLETMLLPKMVGVHAMEGYRHVPRSGISSS